MAVNMALKHFDLLNFVKKSKELGVPEPLAEYQGRQIEEAIEIAVASSHEGVEERELATKKDIKELEFSTKKDLKELEVKMMTIESNLKLEIEKSKNQMIVWLIGLLAVNGLIAHFLK
jgi:hypothetical protein